MGGGGLGGGGGGGGGGTDLPPLLKKILGETLHINTGTFHESIQKYIAVPVTLHCKCIVEQKQIKADLKGQRSHRNNSNQ